MTFNNPFFFLFLAVVLLLYPLGSGNFKKLVLLIASYVFYGLWDWKFLGLIIWITVVIYVFSRQMHTSQKPFHKKLFLAGCIINNLGILAVFKYFNFFTNSLKSVLGTLDVSISNTTLNIVLPIGISFYTFQSLSYAIDVYKNNLKPSERILDFSLFIAFFPQLVAGPIERATNLLPQMVNLDKYKWDNFKSGGCLIFVGYIKKTVISDNLAPFVDNYFNQYLDLGTMAAWTGLILFSLQIYYDFGGYSDIARGVARLFGIKLMVNFNQPYFSTNISEFWRRWHISLSTWLRDYLYIPLGGNRKGNFRTQINLMITMALGGLWHGASWNYVIWGVAHGCYLVAYNIFSNQKGNVPKPWYFSLPSALFVYLLVLFTWIPFRTHDVETTIAYASKLFILSGSVDFHQLLLLLSGPFIVLLIDLPAYIKKDHLYLLSLPGWFSSVIFFIGSVAITFSFFLQWNQVRPFIYFQF
ncbi:MAG: MBOAT family protein [Fibrobacteria bacterium]|nr:MBOAT family protein [Fibrobacteria bacterium]